MNIIALLLLAYGGIVCQYGLHVDCAFRKVSDDADLSYSCSVQENTIFVKHHFVRNVIVLKRQCSENVYVIPLMHDSLKEQTATAILMTL